MKAQILKIAGVKSEKEFYKKFPTEEAFLKKHGKELAKLKKAQVGDVIEYTDVQPVNNRKVIDGQELLTSIDTDAVDPFSSLKDKALELGVESLTTDEDEEDYAYKAKIDAIYNNMYGKKDEGILGKLKDLGSVASMFAAPGTGEDGSADPDTVNMIMSAVGAKKGGKFKPHMMYDPKTGKGYKANKLADHLRMDKKGYTHEPPKKQTGGQLLTAGMPSYVLRELPPEVMKVSPETAELILNVYSQVKENPNDYLGHFNSVSRKDIQNILKETGLSRKEVKNFIKSQDFYKDMNMFLKGSLNTAMFAKGLKKGGNLKKAQFGFDQIDFSSDNYTDDMNFGQKVGKFASEDLGKILASQEVKDIAMGIDKIKSQKDDLKDLRQMREVSGIALQAAMSKPEQIEREYVRPEDIENTGEEFFPIYGVGTNVLAKNGQTMNLFGDVGYSPLVNVNKAKTFQNGGRCWPGYKAVPGKTPFSKGSCTKAQGGGTFLGMGAGPWDAITSIGGDMAYGKKADRDAGSNIGGGIGRGIGTAVGGPIGGAIGDFIGSGIGDLLDRNDRKQEAARADIDRNVKDMTYMKLGPQIQAGYSSFMKKGGKLPGPNNDYGMIGAPGPQILKTFDGKNLNNMLQKASRMPDTLKKGGSVPAKGVKTLWGGEAKAVAYNPYAGGDSIYFDGNSHETTDPVSGQTGIGVAYGPQSIANNEAIVEVEGVEPAAKLTNGRGEEELVIYGDLKIPKEYSAEIGDPEAGGKKFKHYVNNLNDEEARINKQMGKAVESAGDTDNTKWGELVRTTSDAIINGGDMKLQDIANKKLILADLQEALNDTFKEKGIDGNKFISKGEIKAVKDMEDYAKNGGKMETYTDYAEDGTKVKKLKKIEKELHKASKMHKSQAQRIGKMVKAEDGAEIPKAQDSDRRSQDDGLDVNELAEKFDSVQEILDAGYVLDEATGKYYKDVEIEGEFEQDTLRSSMEDVPEGQQMGNEELGKMVGKDVTVEDYEKWKAANSWFFEKYPDWKPETAEDVKLFQREFNKIAENDDQLFPLRVDGNFGRQTVSAGYSTTDSTTPLTERKFAVLNESEEVTTEATTTMKGNVPIDPNILRRLLRDDVENDLDYNQILPEMNAAANNQLEPVYAQTFSPRLRVPYDISLQDSMNEVIAASRAASQNPAVANNPALLAMMQAPAYEALNKVAGEQFRLNQEMKDTVYSGNIDAINQANLLNMGILDKQQERQAQAVANTKETQQEIVKSIADKYQQNKLENRREKVLSELFPNYRFTDDLDLVNQGLTYFNTGQGGVQGFLSQLNQALQNYDPNTTTPTTTAHYGAKLKRIKRNQKNSTMVRGMKKGKL